MTASRSYLRFTAIVAILSSYLILAPLCSLWFGIDAGSNWMEYEENIRADLIPL